MSDDEDRLSIDSDTELVSETDGRPEPQTYKFSDEFLGETADIYNTIVAYQTLISKAMVFASEELKNTRDSDGSPCINHVLRVVDLLHGLGIRNIDTLCVAILHNTVMNSPETGGKIREKFGDRIADLCTSYVFEQIGLFPTQSDSETSTLIRLADMADNLANNIPSGYNSNECRDILDVHDNSKYENGDALEVIVALQDICRKYISDFRISDSLLTPEEIRQLSYKEALYNGASKGFLCESTKARMCVLEFRTDQTE